MIKKCMIFHSKNDVGKTINCGTFCVYMTVFKEEFHDLEKEISTILKSWLLDHTQTFDLKGKADLSENFDFINEVESKKE